MEPPIVNNAEVVAKTHVTILVELFAGRTVMASASLYVMEAVLGIAVAVVKATVLEVVEMDAKGTAKEIAKVGVRILVVVDAKIRVLEVQNKLT